MILIGQGDYQLPGPLVIRAHLPDAHPTCLFTSSVFCHVAGPLGPTTSVFCLMPPQGAFPPQLVNLVIDELGDAYRRSHNYPTIIRRRSSEYEALHACALVSKKWTIRSRAHLFRKVKVEVREGQPTLTPPTSILPCVKKLEIWCGDHPTQVASTADLLKVFSTSPIERLQITGGELADKRVCIQECIHAHSATLRTVKFGGCSLSAPNIGDIVLGPNGLKRLHLNDCELSSGHPLIADTQNPGACLKAAELEFCISADNFFQEGPPMIAAEIARLPYRFSKLNVAHFPTEEWDEAMTATSTLIKANADVLSSLQIRIFAGMFGILGKRMKLLIAIQPRRRHGD